MFLTSLRLRLLLPLAVLCLLIVGAYWAGLHGAFLFDDFGSVVNNPPLRAFDGSLQSLVAAATSGISGPLGRPLSMVSFALNFSFFGDAPFAFKLVNLAIHVANAILVCVFARQVWRSSGFETGTSRSLVPAIAVAAVWSLHPINLTPVLLVVQRMTSLSALFLLAALVLYLYGRQTKTRQGQFAIAAALFTCWPAAVLSKETGLLLPAYIFLCEWLLLGTFRSTTARTSWIAALVIGGVFALLCWTKWEFLTAGYAVRDFSLVERLMTEARVLWFYIGQLVFPAPATFALFHDDIPVSRGLLAPPATLFAIVGWSVVAALAFRWRLRSPLFAFAVFWFLVSHSLESTVFPLEIAYEHRNYLASVGIFLWLASLLFPDRKDVLWQAPRLVLGASFILFCGLVTSMRSSQWADEFVRTQVEVANHPDSARANYQAAVTATQLTLGTDGGNAMAHQMVRFYYRRAAELDKNSKAPLVGLVYLDCANGTPKDMALQSSLIERFSKGRFTFGDRSIVQSLSGLLVEQRLCLNDREAKELIDAALSNPTADGPMRGMIYAVAMDYAVAKLRSVPLALAYAQAAVESDPGSVAFRANLIRLLLRADKVDEARRQYTVLTENHRSARDRPVLNGLKTLLDSTGPSANTN